MRRRSPPVPQAIDDVTGFKVDHASLKMQWDGAMTVNPDQRQPQDMVRVRAETSILPNPRPEAEDVFFADNIIMEDGRPMTGADGSALMTEAGIMPGLGL
jgi:hypothetical protein